MEWRKDRGDGGQEDGAVTCWRVSHGKTVLAQKLLEKYGYPYFLLDLAWLPAENAYRLAQFQKYGCPMVFVNDQYEADLTL